MTLKHRNGMMRFNGNSGASSRPVLICGGAGFIGTNLAARLAAAGTRLILFDNLSRSGVEQNLAWLQRQFHGDVEFVRGDVRDAEALEDCVQRAAAVYHFAAQVAVTTSLLDPLEDFEVNVKGTLNLLEAVRSAPVPPPLFFTSTNKVYGELGGLRLRSSGIRYEPADNYTRAHGVDEGAQLSFHSPYGCSKGAADQYVLDYAASFGIPAVVFRMSCIYGPHQFGTEDQGWVAHFLISAFNDQPITLYGDGMQVRDVLFVEDLVDALILARHCISDTSGQAFNIGGGPDKTTSLLELIRLIGEMNGREPDARFQDWRVGDQRYYVSDIRKFQTLTGWQPEVGVHEGVTRLHEWLLSAEGAVPAMTALHGGAV
ncbi:MAG: SDR family NAD(P)-dependent oxidoreductase [Bryobacteraceae bacterium]